MWKYRCKTHLVSLLVAFLLGTLISLLTFSSGFSVYQDILPAEVYQFMINNKVLVYLSGGLSFAGIINVLMIAQLISLQFNISPFILYVVLLFMPNYMLMIGIILVIPAVILNLYGIYSLRHNQSRLFARHDVKAESEIARIYSIHHKMDESVKDLATECRKNVDRMTIIYALGIVAIFFVMVLIDNLLVAMVIFLFYMFAFNILLRYRASSIIPITALLYEKCDPEACASAIIYFSTKRGKFKLTNHTLLAQCLIYLDDPELAQDVLIAYPRKDAASTLTYWSLMAYINYLLKDEDSLVRCKEEASRVRLNFGTTGVMIQSEEINSIQNRIDLMNSELNTSKRYYLEALKKAKFMFQQVDACYYIALISFVEQDYVLARMYFEKVIQHGNKMAFVEKAKHYQSKIDALDLQEA